MQTETTATAATLEQYRNRGQKLLTKYMREGEIEGGTGEVTALGFARWLASKRGGLKSGTWRHYRLSAAHVIRGMPDAGAEEAVAFLMDVPVPESRFTEKRTSALREKWLPQEDYGKLCTYLTRFAATRRAYETRDWLVAGFLTGLRPCEWSGSVLVRDGDGRVLLHVQNAKATNGRALGKVRTLDLSSFPAPDLAAVERMVKRAAGWVEDGTYAEAQAACSVVVHHACRKIWPRREKGYTLYSARHQAVANFKANLPLVEVAALVGHNCTDTSVANYGKRRAAWEPGALPPLPRPMPEAVALVKENARVSPWAPAAGGVPC